MKDARLEPLTYTKEQAAQILNVELGSINYLVRKGTLPCRKIAGKIRFTMDDLKTFVESSKVAVNCDLDAARG